MYDLKIQNAFGEIYDLTADPRYSVISIAGLNPVPVSVNTADTAGDGGIYTGAFAQMREIVITLVLQGDIERARAVLYRIFPLKMACTVLFKNVNHNVKIIGFVETNEIQIFSQRQQAQISILCPSAWLEAVTAEEYELSNSVANFEAPFSIPQSSPIAFSEQVTDLTAAVYNGGDTECGGVITANFAGATSGVSFQLRKTLGATSYETFGLSSSFTSSHTLTIDTRRGSLSVKKNNTSQLSYLTSGSVWFKFPIGVSYLSVTATSGAENISASLELYPLYMGV